MSEEVDRMLEELERRGYFIGATYEVEHLRAMIDEMNLAINDMADQLRRHIEREEEG